MSAVFLKLARNLLQDSVRLTDCRKEHDVITLLQAFVIQIIMSIPRIIKSDTMNFAKCLVLRDKT